MILALGWSYLHVNGLKRPSLPTHHLETRDGPGEQHGGIFTLSTKSSKGQCPSKKTMILKMCNMQGQCCFQNTCTGPKVESRWEVVTFQVFLGVACKQARMKVYYSLAVWWFKPILSASLWFHLHLSGGLRLRNYRAVAENHKFCSRFSVFGAFSWQLFNQS